MTNASPDTALDASIRFGLYFLLPGMILFYIFWVVHHIAHISAFAKKLTPYPKGCTMKCAGMPWGMWLLFQRSFQRQLTDTLGIDRKAATKTIGYGDDECNFHLMSKERANEIGFIQSPDAK